MPPELNLRDIALADLVSGWPPALGWWLLLALILLLAGVAWWGYRRYQKLALKRAALAEFSALEARFKLESELQPLLAELSIFLRRVCLSLPAYRHVECAGLQGEAWLKFLDRALVSNEFENGVGRLLLQAPYAPRLANHLELDELLPLLRRWLLALPWTEREPL